MERDAIRVMTATTAVGVFAESKVGVVGRNDYKLIKPKSLLVAAGAREKALVFPGCDLPGVYGAGAFQTLLNRDLVKPIEQRDSRGDLSAVEPVAAVGNQAA